MPPSLRLAESGDVLSLAALAAAGLAILAGGALRRLRPWRLWGLPASFLLASAGLLAASNLLPPPMTLAGLLVLASAGGLFVPVAGEDSGAARPAGRSRIPVLVVALLAAGGILFRGLGDPSRVLQAWEPDVLSCLEKEMVEFPSGVSALTSRLHWQQGLVSSGGDSLLYGLPTFLLLSGKDVSVLSLRLASALLALGCLVLCWAATRRFFGDEVAACATLLCLLAPPFLFYGRYGTSVTAMWASLWLALWAVYALLSHPSTGRAMLAALALYVATLQYAPGRVVVVALMGLAAVTLPVASGTRSARACAALALAALVATAIAVNSRGDGIFNFYNARGEQVFRFRHQPDMVEEYLGHPVETRVLPWREMPGLALRVARTNLRAFQDVVAPVTRLSQGGEVHSADPPRLPLLLRTSLPLALWGLVLSFRKKSASAPGPAGFFAVFLLAAIPLLLTNRVDVARAGGLLPFLVIWGALGGADLLKRLVRAVGRPAAAVVISLFLLGSSAGAGSAVVPEEQSQNVVGESLLAEIAVIEGPLRLGVLAPRVQLGSAWLAAMGHLHRRGVNLPALLDEGLLDRLSRQPEREPEALDEVVALVRATPLLLGPFGDFSHLQAPLTARGLDVDEVGTNDFPLLRIRTPAILSRP